MPVGWLASAAALLQQRPELAGIGLSGAVEAVSSC